MKNTNYESLVILLVPRITKYTPQHTDIKYNPVLECNTFVNNKRDWC